MIPRTFRFHNSRTVMESALALVCCLAILCAEPTSGRKYAPTWSDIDSRPLPDWYDQSKIGVFVHWGVFSVPSYSSEWFWERWQGNHYADVIAFMKRNYAPSFTYPDFAPQFTAEFYNPNQWADLFQASGARYVVLTSKHHEGYTNWPSKHSWNWNSMDVGPKRDLVGELATAVRNRTSIHFGLYHSLFEWFHPLYLQDKANNFKTQDFVMTKTLPELKEIVNTYHPEVIWSDGDWEAPSSYWNATEFLAWLYNESPVKDTVVVNDRWGSDCHCKHGGFYNCHDSYNPGKLQSHKWEDATPIDKHSWGYRRTADLSSYRSIHQLLTSMVSAVSCGGNFIANIGPTKEGTIPTILEMRLREMGSWLKVNGEAIYESIPWTHQNDTVTPNVWYTSKKSSQGGYDVFATVFDWPAKNRLELGAVKPNSNVNVTMLGYAGQIAWVKGQAGDIIVNVPYISPPDMPSQWAWVFKVVGL